ncbi:hypothetical protein IJI31_06575 [bacterium]|nr:hypothetical protein [bacterium]
MRINLATQSRDNSYPYNLLFFKAKKDRKLPEISVQTPEKDNPVGELGLPYDICKKYINAANSLKMSTADYLKMYMPHLFWEPQIKPEKSVTDTIGNTKVQTLIDGEQIFGKTLDYIYGAKDSIQIEMFEFQNVQIDGDRWPSNGAEVVPGFEQQQRILSALVEKKQENPDLNVQIILDAHKWYMDGHGRKERHYNNMKMIKYLKDNGFDVVPYPRAAQQGATLQHVKMLAVDGNKAIIGGMNWGTHSAANHDACVALETLPDKQNSEVDNLIENIFNKDWKFAWQRLGATDLVKGPLTEDEQKNYFGLNQEIKMENVEYMNIVGTLYDNPKDRNRYTEGNLNLVETNPVENPQIKILATKPKELVYVDENGKETTREYLKEKINTSKKLRAELFVLSDKELIQNIIKRHKDKTLDAKIIVHPEVLEEFPYCRKAYNELVKNEVPVRLFNYDERVNQRMHAKWAVFDDEELIIGSTNWSGVGLNSNLKKGQRDDYDIHTEMINEEIRGYLKELKEFEKDLGLPSVSRKRIDYKELKVRKAKFRKAYADLDKTGSASVHLGKNDYYFSDKDKSTLSTISGYYTMILDRNNAKEKYKRGNNEVAIAFQSPKIAKTFERQFDKDWKNSVDEYDELRDKVLDSQTNTKRIDLIG